MVDALKVTWQSLKDLWDEFVILIMLNVIWGLSLLLALAPLFLLGSADLGLALVLSLLFSIPIPIVSGALCFVTNQIAHERAVGWDTFVTGLRLYWRKSLVVAFINLVALILIVANLWFYAFYLEGDWTILAVAAWILLSLYWAITQIYWFPMLLELEDEKVLLALRNALSLVLVSPGFSLVLALVLLVLTVLCIGLTIPLPLFMAVLLLLIINRATIYRIAVIRAKYEARLEEE
jgi:hypothetical protein